jgi:hypothetical protein
MGDGRRGRGKGRGGMQSKDYNLYICKYCKLEVSHLLASAVRGEILKARLKDFAAQYETFLCPLPCFLGVYGVEHCVIFRFNF